MAKYMQDSTDIQINEVSGTDNINFSFKSGNSIDTKIGDLAQLNTTNKSNLVGAINEIVVESGTNEIGEYIKYANGRLITMHKVTRKLARTSSWGSMFESTTQADLGNYPIAFKDIPFVYVTLHDVNSMLEAVQFTSANNAGKVFVLGPTSNASEDYVFQVLAIGKWR